MDDAEFGVRVDRMLVALDRACLLLEGQGEYSLADWLAADLTLIASGERYGIDRLVGAFDGMGSLSDVPLGMRDDDVGHELRQLTSAIYDDATALQRVLDRRWP